MAALATRPRARPRVRAAATPANQNLPNPSPATAHPAPRLATAELAIAPTDVPNARSSLKVNMQPRRMPKTRRRHQLLEVRLPLGQRRLLLHLKGMRGQRTEAIQGSAADSSPLRASSQTFATTKPRGPRLALALNIRRPAVEIDSLHLRMLEACPESLPPVVLVANSLTRDAMIRSNLLRSKEAKATHALHLVLLRPVSPPYLPPSPRS